MADKKVIFEESEVKISFYSKKGTCILEGVNFKPITKSLSEFRGMKRHDKFHVTIVGYKQGREVKQIFKDSQKLRLVYRLVDRFNKRLKQESCCLDLTGEAVKPCLVKRDSVTSLVVCFSLTNSFSFLEDFVLELSKILGIEVKLQPHITWYSSDGRGIGVSSGEEMSILKVEEIDWQELQC